MSETAIRERTARQGWAVPGSAHDRLVRWSKVVLPVAVGILIAVLMLAPLDRNGDVSFILDKKKVENAPERMRVESARYTGTDDRGQQFVITAQRAIQPSSDTPIVAINGMAGRLVTANGPVLIAANDGRYNLDTQAMAIPGPVRVQAPDGYHLQTSNVGVSLKTRQLASGGPVSGTMTLGQFEAGRLRADLGARTVVLDGGARLKIVQGAVR